MTDPKLAREQVEVLYQRHFVAVRRFLLGVTRDPDLADEAAQRTFLVVLDKGHTADEDSMKGWIFKVAFHEAMAVRRRESATGARFDRGLEAQDLLRAAATPGDLVDGAIERDELARAQDAVRELPAEQQQVLRMRFTEAKTFAQIAGELGVPLGTALTRMRLALTKLRRKLT